MEYRLLGRTGLKISTISLGTMTFGGAGPFARIGDTDVTGAKRMVDMCLDAGVNLFDTADVYSAGQSEEILGQAIADKRESLLVATKARFPSGRGPNDRGLSRHHLIRACEASLKRLGTDHIDLYWLHEWDGQTAVEETLGALAHLLDAGKIRTFGVSNFAGWQLMKMIGASERMGLPRPCGQQIHYTLQAREAEQELIPIAVDADVPAVVWSPLAGGLLSGKYRRGQAAPEGSRGVGEWKEPPIRDENKLYDIVEVLLDIAGSRNVSAAQVALAWLLGRTGVASLVIGARTIEQLADNLKAAELSLSAEERERLDRASLTPLPYPYWHQANTAFDRLSPADLALLAPHLKR
jgi:aryl-alcohol dehydrogenase-like predicted oxidoreductase